jgi:hypothetical protein
MTVAGRSDGIVRLASGTGTVDVEVSTTGADMRVTFHLDQRTRTDAGPGNFLLTPNARAVVSAAHGADTIRAWTLD